MKRCFDETGPSEAGGDNFNSCTDVVDNAAFESHHSSCVRLTTSSCYKQTWDLVKGGPPLLREFSTSNIRVGPLPLLPGVFDVVECSPAIVDMHVFGMRRTVDSRSWENKLRAHLVAAIRKWAGIILVLPLAFDIGRNDVFAGRSAGAMHNRANPMIRFAAWCKAPGYEPFPLDEEVCYRFALNSEHTAPTFLRRCLVRIPFSFYVLGLSGGESCMGSARLNCWRVETLLEEQQTGWQLGFSSCVCMRACYRDGLNLVKLFVDCPEPNRQPLYGLLKAVLVEQILHTRPNAKQ